MGTCLSFSSAPSFHLPFHTLPLNLITSHLVRMIKVQALSIAETKPCLISRQLCSQFRKSRINPHCALSPSTLAQHLCWPVNSPAAVVQNGTAAQLHSHRHSPSSAAAREGEQETCRAHPAPAFVLKIFIRIYQTQGSGRQQAQPAWHNTALRAAKQTERRMCSSLV